MKWLKYLAEQIGCIYVWGAQGKDLGAMTQADAEAWIRKKETWGRSGYAENKARYDANAERAIALYHQRLYEGREHILAFDCSGLLMYFLQNLTGLLSSDHSAKMIYNQLCDVKYGSAAELRPGDPVFYSKSGKAADIGHVGVYIGDGRVEESKNQLSGVVVTQLSDRPWNYFGHISVLEPYLVDKPVHYELTEPRLSGSAVAALQRMLNLSGYHDDDDKLLDEDGVFGARSDQALTKFLAAHTPAAPAAHSITVCTEPFGVLVDGVNIDLK
jgi:hypothetical protein